MGGFVTMGGRAVAGNFQWGVSSRASCELGVRPRVCAGVRGQSPWQEARGAEPPE